MEREEAILHNLICFSLVFSRHYKKVIKQSPIYILEKFNRCIVGELPRKYWEFIPTYKNFKFKDNVNMDELIRDLDDINISTFMEYKRTWVCPNHIERILIYLLLSDQMVRNNSLCLYNIVNQFERIIGPVIDVNNIEIDISHVFVSPKIYSEVIEKNKSAIKMIKRDLKLQKIN